MGDETLIEVGEITIFNQPVLRREDFFAPLVNFFHFVTQKTVIRDALNFKSGDKISRADLYNAERYVRMLDPIKEAVVLETPNKETGKSDITVVTRDRLSAYIRTGTSGSGGYTSMGLEAGETSLFGRLYYIQTAYVRENFRDFIGLGVGKLRIGGTKWQAGASAFEGFADARRNYESVSGYISHPFIVDGQKHAFEFRARKTNGVLYDYYASGIRQGYDPIYGKFFDLVYRNYTENIAANYLYGIGKNNRIEIGAGFEHLISQDYYINKSDSYSLSKTPEVLVSPLARNFYLNEQLSSRGVTFTLNTRNGNYLPMKNFHRYLFTEDQFDGFRTSTQIFHANPAFGLSDHYTRTDFFGTWQHNFFQNFLRFEAALSRVATFWENRYTLPRDDVAKIDFRVFQFFRWGTLAARTFAAYGNNMSAYARREVASQFSRGFYYGSFLPSSGVLMSAEYRSPGLKLPYVLVAGVVFIDYSGVGNTSQVSSLLGSLDWYPVVGLGLRTMLYEIDNNIFRVDFGFNLKDGAFDFLKSLQFGMSHSF
ncbi:MAG: hypothetical protein LDLANPLL_01667 [Turneriella sp.]|nr:hypothetical protein [Turneriella sp.]